LREDVLHAFERGSDGEKVFAAAHGGDGFGAGHEVTNVIVPSGHRGLHNVVGLTTPFAQVEIDALVEEGVQLGRNSGVGAAAVSTSESVSGRVDSARIFTMAFAARRRAKGSFEPVGSMPSANMLAMVSMRSASPRCSLPPSVGSHRRQRRAGIGRRSRRRRWQGRPCERGVEAADDALQLGELLDQLGSEVGLGESRRLR
jgi:hypothetical protein